MINGVHFFIIFALLYTVCELLIKLSDERKRKERMKEIVKEFTKEKRAITNTQM